MALAYQKTEPAHLERTFRTLFGSMEQDAKDVAFRRATAANIVIVVSSKSAQALAEEYVHAFAGCRPSRIFVVFLDASAAALEVGATALCHGLGRDLQVCSEIVQLRTPPAVFRSLPSIIRANLLFSAPTELAVLDPSVPEDVVRALGSFCDSVIFDAALFDTKVDALKILPQISSQLLDLQWVGLGIWRDQIKSAFEKPALLAALPSLVSITLQGGGASTQSPTQMLLAGWILSRLGLSVSAKRGDTVECTRPGRGTTVRLQMLPAKSSAAQPLLEEVRFDFVPLANAVPRIERVRLVRNGPLLETLVEPGPSFKVTRPFDDERATARLQRYFLIGESTANYGSSLRTGLTLAA